MASGRRPTKHDYEAPGSFARLVEASIALADCDAEDEACWHRAKARLLQAVMAYKGNGHWLDFGNGQVIRGRRVRR